MRYELVKGIKEEEFRRLTGVKRSSFEKMLAILQEAEKRKKKLGGKPNTLQMPDRLLMALEYLREYRTYFYIAASYDILESASYRNLRWIENILIKHPDFALPGRKALLKTDIAYEVVLVDVTESPIERPKKSRGTTTEARKKDTH